MSLMNAKRTADLREQVSQGAKKLEQMHDEIRRGITAEVMAEFETYLGSNGFALSPTLKGKKATYKDLTIELRPGTEAYFGAYHTFTLMVAGKEIYVRVLAKFSGDVERTPPSSTPVSWRSWKENLQVLKSLCKAASLRRIRLSPRSRWQGVRSFSSLSMNLSLKLLIISQLNNWNLRRLYLVTGGAPQLRHAGHIELTR